MKTFKVALRALAFLSLMLAFGPTEPVSAANGSVTYTYDALGRLTTASYDTGVIIIYSYDANGNRTCPTNGRDVTHQLHYPILFRPFAHNSDGTSLRGFSNPIALGQR